MTVRINKPALNLREELTKAQGVVRYEQRQFWMDGLVENGTFDSDLSGWTVTDATVASVNGVAEVTNTNGGWTAQISQNITTEVGKTYAVSYFVPSDSTASYVYCSGIHNVSQKGHLSFTFTATSTSTTFVYKVNDSAVGGVFKIDNVSVFEVDENDNVIHSVPLGFKPVHVYEDGLLQREGTNHDYTVVDTGFGYQVKPTVAPSATTETCIIAEREL